MTDRQKYTVKIAGLAFHIDSYPDSLTMERFEAYRTEDYIASPDLSITCDITDREIPEPDCTRLTDKEEVNWYSPGEGRYYITFYDFNNGIICAMADYNQQSKSANVTVYDVRSRYGIDDSVVLLNVLERVFRLALVFNGGFVIHASSIIHEGYGIAFSAESGTGKSTHTGLWLSAYPDTYILNDDAPALRLTDGGWYIFGTPWAGTTGINVNASAPLKSVVFLERGIDNKIRTCSALEGIKRLFEAIVHPVSDELVNIVLESVSKFISDSSMCVLNCNMTEDAPRTVKNYLY